MPGRSSRPQAGRNLRRAKRARPSRKLIPGGKPVYVGDLVGHGLEAQFRSVSRLLLAGIHAGLLRMRWLPVQGIIAARARRASSRREGAGHDHGFEKAAPSLPSPAWASSRRSASARRKTGRRLPPGARAFHAITRFRLWPAHHHRRHGGWAVRGAIHCARLSEKLAALAAEEAGAESGIGGMGDFPGPLFMAVPPVEMEWAEKQELAGGLGRGRRHHL